MMGRHWAPAIITLFIGVFRADGASAQATPDSLHVPVDRSIARPAAFEQNRGQFDDQVAYRSRVASRTVALGHDGSVTLSDPRTPSALTRFHLVAASRAQLSGVERLPARVRYLHGNDPTRWIDDVPLYGRLRLRDIYPGIDWEWKPSDQTVEYDFIVQPGAEPRQIEMQFSRSARLRIVHGDLHVLDGGQKTVHRRPVAFQTIDGRTRHVKAEWRVRGSRAGFRVGAYDRLLPLIIDPVLTWSTHVGTASVDFLSDVAVAPDGSIFLAGETTATQDAFIAKLTGSGDLVYTTHFGGTGRDFGPSIAVSGDQVYVAGATESSDFPVVAAAQPQSGGVEDGYAGLLRSDGGFLFSTYLGGSNADGMRDVVAVADGSAWVVGRTLSADWPTVAAMDATFGGSTDGVLVHISSFGQLLMSSYVGHTDCESGLALSVAPDGTVYMAGSVGLGTIFRCSVTVGWLVKLTAGGTSLAWSLYLFGTDSLSDVATIQGRIWATGFTRSATLPTTPDAYDSSCGSDGACNGTSDAVLIVRNDDGSPAYASYIGGDGFEDSTSLTSDGNGAVWVVGTTGSTTWPEASGTTLPDAFVMRFEAASRTATFATRFGGTHADQTTGVSATAHGVYLAGWTSSPSLPAERNPPIGEADGFVAYFASLARAIFIDGPVNEARVLRDLQIEGWALDDRSPSGSGVDAVHVWAFSLDDPAMPSYFLGVAQYGLARPDVAAAFGARYESSGYRLAATLPNWGRYLIGVYGRATTTMQFEAVRTVVVNAVDQARTTIDVPASGADVIPPLVVAGLALNPEATPDQGTGIDGVDVWAFPAGGAPAIFVGAAVYGVERADAAVQFGAQFRYSGYQVTGSHLWPGTYTLAAYPHYAGTNRYGAPAVTGVRLAAGPHVWIDQPVASSTNPQPFTISGWAIDHRATTGTGIDHVVIYANRLPDTPGGVGTMTFIGSAEWGLPRSDVASAFGEQFANCGYRLSVSGLPPGFYRVAVYAHGVDPPPGSFPYFETWTGIVSVQ